VGKAIVRNHVKRQVREWFRKTEFRRTLDLVVIARSGVGQWPVPKLRHELDRLTASARTELADVGP